MMERTLFNAVRCAVSLGWTVEFRPDALTPGTVGSWICHVHNAQRAYSSIFAGDDATARNADWLREIIRAHA